MNDYLLTINIALLAERRVVLRMEEVLQKVANQLIRSCS